MSFLNYCNVLLKNHNSPSFIADAANYKVLYQNPAMEQLLSKRESVIGKEFYKVVVNADFELNKAISFDWEERNIFERSIFDSDLEKHFIARIVRIVFNAEFYILITYDSLDNKSSGNTLYSFEQAMSKCISALQKTGEEKNIALLKILGEYYRADKTYLFHIDKQTKKIPPVSHWCKNDTIITVDDLTDEITFDNFMEWFETRNEVGIIETSTKYADNEDNITNIKNLNAHNIENVAMCVIENINKEPTALVSIINRENLSGDLRLLQAISTFLEKDVTKAEINQTVQQINEIDLLTGFFSRTAYSQKIDSLQCNPPKSLGIVFANINGLKKINSEFGYAKGDSYIKKSTNYLQNYFKDNFYRISGDEFLGFVEGLDKSEFDDKIDSLMKQMKVDNNISFSLGYAFGSGRVDVDSLIKEADTIMYINKQEYYNSSNRSYQDINDTTLSDLLSYLENDEFMIYLQPQVLLSDGSLYGAEALIRRFDKTNQKMVFPDQFISLYEKKSVIRHVDIFVVEQVCEQLAKWTNQGVRVPVSVNLSRVTLQEYGIVDTIARICDRYKVDRNLLIIEVTERVGLIENNVASSLITEFKERGFKISLDDFGCAYSNIVTLAQIEVDEVKIDKSLVDDLTNNKKNYILVKNVLAMCNELEGASTLAEGIEDENQAKILHELGCHLGQGYFYSRPIPLDEFCAKYTDK